MCVWCTGVPGTGAPGPAGPAGPVGPPGKLAAYSLATTYSMHALRQARRAYGRQCLISVTVLSCSIPTAALLQAAAGCSSSTTVQCEGSPKRPRLGTHSLHLQQAI